VVELVVCVCTYGLHPFCLNFFFLRPLQVTIVKIKVTLK